MAKEQEQEHGSSLKNLWDASAPKLELLAVQWSSSNLCKVGSYVAIELYNPRWLCLITRNRNYYNFGKHKHIGSTLVVLEDHMCCQGCKAGPSLRTLLEAT